jgi:DNA-binding MarR family transcriptional regulator
MRSDIGDIVQTVNSSSQERISEVEQFERLYRRLWAMLRNPDDAELTQHERQFLHHVPIDGAVSLGELARHLALPKSSASVIVKSLARRGFLTRTRDELDERRLRIELTDEGRARVQADTVLAPAPLAAALARLSDTQRRQLLRSLAALADAAEAAGSPPGQPAS